MPRPTVPAGLCLGTPPPAATAASQVRAALEPGSVVGFPQVTEICERLEAEPSELPGVVLLLVAALRDPRASLRVKLQALTISNEMMYNSVAVAAFRSTCGVQEALDALRANRGLEDSDVVTTEIVRTLAIECSRVCFPEGGAASREAFVAPQRGELWTPWTTSSAMGKNLQKLLEGARAGAGAIGAAAPLPSPLAPCQTSAAPSVAEAEATAEYARARALEASAHATFDKSDYAGAAADRQEAVQLLRGVGAIRTEFGATVLGELGLALLLLGNAKGGLQACEEALGVRRRIGGLDTESGARLLVNVGTAKAQLDDMPGALHAFEEALRLRRHLGHLQTVAGARALRNVGLVRRRLGDHAGAAQAFTEALAVQEFVEGPQTLRGAQVLWNIAASKLVLGDFFGAVKASEASRSLLAQLSLSGTPLCAEVLGILGLARLQLGDYRRAAEACGEAVALHRRLGSLRSLEATRALANLGTALLRVSEAGGGSSEEGGLALARAAEEALGQARGLLEELHALVSEDGACVLRGLGLARRRRGEAGGAAAALGEAQRIIRCLGLRDTWLGARVARELGECCDGGGRAGAAGEAQRGCGQQPVAELLRMFGFALTA